MVFHKEYCRRFVGQWVHCHSVYGVHQGLVHRALHDGIILVQYTSLASGQAAGSGDFQPGVHSAHDGRDVTPVQFPFPFVGPGLFIPYGGIFGLSPFPFII
jgi:hypothetical protein